MKISKSDILIILPLSVLLILGLVMVTSSSIYIADDMTSNPFHFAQRQTLFVSMGLIAMLIFLVLPSDFLYRTDWVFMLLSIFLLIILFIPDIGTSVNGSIRWIRIGPINVKPSEICKFSLILYISGYSVCMKVKSVNFKHEVILGKCDNMNLDSLTFSENNQIHLTKDKSYWLTVVENSLRTGKGGSPIHKMRDIELLKCNKNINYLQKWGYRN